MEENTLIAPEEAPEPEQAEVSPDLEAVGTILSKYWCAPHDDEGKFFEEVCKREDTYLNALLTYGMFDQYRLAYNTYWGFSGGASSSFSDFQTQSIRAVGPEGQLEYCVNEYRSFADQIVNMTTKNRPAFQAQSTNDDSLSVSQVESADTLVKYYYEQIYGEPKEKGTVRTELNYGKAFTYIDWDPDGGAPVTIKEDVPDPEGVLPEEEKQIEKEVKPGDFLFHRLFPWQVACDPFKSELTGHSWRILNFKKNKYDLIARYPLYAEAIDAVTGGDSSYEAYFPGFSVLSKDADEVTVRVVLHAPCAVLPQGRRAIFAGEKLIDDGALPIDEIPLIPYITGELDGTCFGVSDLWNLIPCQQMNNAIMSNVANNIDLFGRPIISMYSAGEPNIDELANGSKLLMYDNPESKPEIMKPPDMSEEPLKVFQTNRGMMQALTGLNGISRGESDAAVKSGAHAALYHAMAAESQSPRQTELDLNRERIGNIVFKFLRKYAQHPQMVAIAGENERPYLAKMAKESMQSIQRVSIKTTSPMMRTTAGKLQLADIMRQWPGMPIKDPSEIWELVTTGQLKPLYNATRAETIRIKEENEKLLRGPKVVEVPGQIDPATGMPGAPTKTVPEVPVMITDDIKKHAPHHLETLYSNWDNPKVRDAVTVHLLEHFSAAQKVSPLMAGVLGLVNPQQFLPPEIANIGNQGGGGAPPPPSGDSPAPGGPIEPPGNPAMTNEVDAELDDSQGGKLPVPAEPPN